MQLHSIRSCMLLTLAASGLIMLTACGITVTAVHLPDSVQVHVGATAETAATYETAQEADPAAQQVSHQFLITRNIFPDQKKRGFHAPLAQAVQQLFRVHPVRSIVEGQRQLPAGKAFRGGNRLVRLLHFCQIFPLHPHCQPAHDS